MYSHYPLPKYNIDLHDKKVKDLYVRTGNLRYFLWLYSVKHSLIILKDFNPLIKVVDGINFLRQTNLKTFTEMFIFDLLNDGTFLFGDIKERIISFPIRAMFLEEKEKYKKIKNELDSIEICIRTGLNLKSTTFSILQDCKFTEEDLLKVLTNKVYIENDFNEVIASNIPIRNAKIWLRMINWITFLLRKEFLKRSNLPMIDNLKTVKWEKEVKKAYPLCYEKICQKIKYKYN